MNLVDLFIYALVGLGIVFGLIVLVLSFIVSIVVNSYRNGRERAVIYAVRTVWILGLAIAVGYTALHMR